MLISYKRGQGSIILRVKIRDSAQTDGRGKTGLTSSSAGLKIATIADNESATTVYAQASSNIETITTLGTFAAPTSSKCRFKEVGSDHPGIYEIQIADARFAVSSAKSLLVSISGASGVVETDCLIPLVDLDPYTPKVTLANGVAHGGSTATLELGSTSSWALNVHSSGGTAALIQSTDSGSSGGMEISGNSYGLKLTGTVTGDLYLGGTGTIYGPIFTTDSLAQIIGAFADDLGTAQAGAAGTITLRAGAVATNDYYVGAVVNIYGGTGAGQSRKITAYNGTTKVATVDSNWVTNPDNTSTYFVMGRIA